MSRVQRHGRWSGAACWIADGEQPLIVQVGSLVAWFDGEQLWIAHANVNTRAR